MASPKQILKDANRSLEIRIQRRDGKPQVGIAPVLDEKGGVVTPASEDFKPATPGISTELELAEAALARVTDRVNKAKIAVEKNDSEIAKYTRLVSALSVLEDDDDDDETTVENDGQTTLDEIADESLVTSDEITTEEAPARVNGRFAKKG